MQAGFDDWRSYAYCYRRAAQELAERFPVPLDAPEAMFLPVLYLFRHYVEAALKGILAEAAKAYSLDIKIPEHHRLDLLWCRVREILEARPGVLDDDWFNRADGLIRELHGIDPGSMHFRYPVDKQGVRLLMPGFAVSTMSVRDAMDDLSYVLDNLAGYVSAIVDFDANEGDVGRLTT